MPKKSKTNNSVGCVSVLIFFGVILCFASSWKSGIFFVLLGIVISAISNNKPNKKSPPPLQRNQNRKKGKTAKWFAKDANISIGDKSIGGFVYVGEHLAPVNSAYSDYSSYVDYDAVLIRPSLKVNFNKPDFRGANLDYWPTYTEIPPTSRAAYLLWLTNGKSAPDISIGYVFLYFYGLERRLLSDMTIDLMNEEPLEIINELIRLFAIYADQSRSFRNYCSNLICTGILKYYQDHLEIIPDSVLNAFNFQLSPIVKFKFAEFAYTKQPVSAKWAFALISSHPEISLKMPAKRCPEKFKELFIKLYEKKYGDGITVDACKNKLRITYNPSSSTLEHIEEPVNIPKGYSDVASLKGTLNNFLYILDECYELLSPYSRFLGRAPHLEHSLEAVLLLPIQLISDEDERVNKVKQELINDDMKSRGLRSIKLKTLCKILEIPTKDNLSIKAIRDIKNSMVGLGFGFSPDYDYCGLKAEKDQKVVIFQVNSDLPNLEREKIVIQRLMLFLRLGMLIAAADGHVSMDEVDFLTNIIEENDLSENSRICLWAFLEFLLNNKVSSASLNKNIANLSTKHKDLIIQYMTALVQVDGKIDNKEVVQLEKIFKMLGLDNKMAITHLHRNQASANEPVLVAQKTKEQDFKIPPYPVEESVNKPVIDYSKIAMKQKETEEVFSVLVEIFKDDNDISNNKEKSTKFSELDEKHQQFFEFLITQSEWPRTAVEEYCKPIQLMVDGAMEVINEYAILKYEEPLLEGDDPIYVELELAQEIQNG